MFKRHLSDVQKEKFIGAAVVILGALVLLGQVVETRSALFRDLLTVLRLYVDPIQYMVGMLVINFILVLTAIKKYEQYPNPFLNTLKWYFSLLLMNDFMVLVLRVFQKSNLVALKSNLGVGMGRSYMILSTVRGLTELTFTSAATFLLVYGLIRYSPIGQDPRFLNKRLGKIMLSLVILQWFFSIPVNLTLIVSSRTVYAFFLGLSQAGQVAVVVLIYWVVKEYHLKYHTRFFRHLTSYFTLTLAVTGLIFTYSMGSYGLMQRFPAGENGMIGGFGQLVFYISRVAFIVLNYLMFRAITDYAEAPKIAESQEFRPGSEKLGCGVTGAGSEQ